MFRLLKISDAARDTSPSSSSSAFRRDPEQKQSTEDEDGGYDKPEGPDRVNLTSSRVLLFKQPSGVPVHTAPAALEPDVMNAFHKQLGIR